MSGTGFSALAGMVLVGDHAHAHAQDFEEEAPPPSKKARTTTTMRCEHSLLATELKVSKDGPNKGRSFFKCPKHEKTDQCSYFAWADEAVAAAAAGSGAAAAATGSGSGAAAAGMKCKCKLGAIVLEVKKEGKNKGKKFFKCGKREEAERCDFFEWVDQPTSATSAGMGSVPQQQQQQPRVSYSSATKPSASAMPRMDARKTRLLQSLRTEHGAFSEVFIHSPAGNGIGRLIVDPYSLLLFSSRAEDFSAINAKRATGMTVSQAIDAVLRDREAT